MNPGQGLKPFLDRRFGHDHQYEAVEFQIPDQDLEASLGRRVQFAVGLLTKV